MATANLGTAEGRIRTTYDGSGTKRAKADMTDLEKSSGRTSKGLTTIGKASMVAGGLLVGAFAIAVKTSADFEKQISAVGAVSGATSEEMDKIRETALRIGKDTKFSASEAAVAMEELAKAGVSTTDILGGAADATVALAAAGGIELPQAATIASNAMNAFALSAQDLPHVADLIAGAANASAIDVGEFGQSLQQAGAVAHTVGVPFDDLAVAIAELGNAGIKGSDAGTSLKTMLQNLNPQTAKQRDLMKELGIVTADGANKFFDAKGNIKSLADVSQVLQDSLQGQTKQQKLATLETLFGSDAIRAAAIMAENGAAGFNDLAENMGKVSAADVAAKRMDNLAGSIEQFKGSLETALITAGAPFQSGLRTIVDLATGLVNAFANLSGGTQKLIGQLVAFGGAFLLIGGAMLLAFVKIMQFVQSVKAAIIALKAFGIASKLAFLTNPVFLIIAAIIALVAVFVLLYKKNETFRKAVQTGWAAIMGVIRNVANAFKALFAAFSGEGITTEAGTLVGAFERIGVAARGVYDAIVTGIGAAVDFFIAAWQRARPVLTIFWTYVTTTIRNAIAIITGIFKLFAAILTGNWTAAWNALKGIAGAILNQIGNTIKTIIGVILAGWTAWGARMLSALVGWVGRVLSAIAAFAAALPGRILFAIGFIIGRWIQFQVKMIAGAIRMGAQVLSAVISFFSKLPGRIASFLSTALSRMVSWATGMISRARSAGSQVLSAISSFFSQLPGRVASYLSSALSRMRTFASQLPSLARQAASGVISAISGGLAALPGIVSGAVGRAISAFQGMVGQAFAAAKALASSLWSGFKAGLFGSPKTLIEYALINMNEATARELSLFEKQSADIVAVSESLAKDATSALAGLGDASANITGNVAVSGRSAASDELKKQTQAMTRLAAAVPRGESVVRVAAAAGGGGPATLVQNNTFNISGMADAAQVRTVVTSTTVLRPLAQAARARGGG